MGVYHLDPSSPDDVDDVPPRAASDSSFCIFFQLIPQNKAVAVAERYFSYAKSSEIGSKTRLSATVALPFPKKRNNSHHLFGEK